MKISISLPDEIVNILIKICRKHGIDTPHLCVKHVLLKCIEKQIEKILEN